MGQPKLRTLTLSLTVSFTLITTRDFPYDESIALDALRARENIMNITIDDTAQTAA